MRKYIDVTGKTEDEAIQNALRQLGLDRDDVSVEILERAKSGFLGLGSCPAKVRVSYGPEEEEPALERREEPVRPAREERRPVEEKKPEESPAKKISPVSEERTHESAAPASEDLGEEVNDEKAQAIRGFLSGLLEQMESSTEIQVYLPEKGHEIC